MRKNASKFLSAIALMAFFATATPGSADLQSPPLKVNFVSNEPSSLVNFIDSISGRPHSTSWLASWFTKKRSAYASDEDLAKDHSVLAGFKNLMAIASDAYDFKDRTGQRPLNLDQEIIATAAECNSLAELFDKLRGKVKEADLQKLREVYEYFEPLYKKLLWEPRLKSLKEQNAEFDKRMIETKMIERLGAVQHFMKASWPADIPFTIVLVPLPDGGRDSHGESLGVVQVVELFPKSVFSKQSDVVFHEICHALWGMTMREDEVKKDFYALDGGKSAYAELNEGIATALGQGWFSNEAFGKPMKNWYDDPLIARNAHALYPILSEYLKDNRQIDKDFARRATEAFNKEFPNYGNRIRVTSQYVILGDGQVDFSQIKDAMQEHLPHLHDYSISSPLDASESIKSFTESQAEHKAILVSADKLDKLLKLGVTSSQIEFIRAHSNKPITLKVAGANVLFCVADTPSEQEDIFVSILSRENWPPLTTK